MATVPTCTSSAMHPSTVQGRGVGFPNPFSYFENELKLSLEHGGVTHDLIGDFREPNEYPENELVAIFERMEEGTWLVSTGTERSFFNLLLAPVDCQGIIVRDINPKVKAYNDCVTLLLRISENREDFVELSSFAFFAPAPMSIAMKSKTDTIQDRIASDQSMPIGMKEHYQSNLQNLTEAYFGAQRAWRWKKDYNNINYITNEKQFYKLRSYANAGRIITTTGAINDLRSLSSYDIRVGVVDTSNICDFSLLDIKVEGNPPQIIWTIVGVTRTRYHSYTAQNLCPEDNAKLHGLWEQIKEQWNTARPEDSFPQDRLIQYVRPFHRKFHGGDPHTPFPSATRETLVTLERFLESPRK